MMANTLCSPRWLALVKKHAPGEVERNLRMFLAFREIEEDDLRSEASLAACRAEGRFNPKRSSAPTFIKRVVKYRLIDLARQSALRHRKDRDFADRSELQCTDDAAAVSRRLDALFRSTRINASGQIPGEAHTLRVLYRYLCRFVVRFETMPTLKQLPRRLRLKMQQRINGRNGQLVQPAIQYRLVAREIRQIVVGFIANRDVGPAMAIHDPALARERFAVSAIE